MIINHNMASLNTYRQLSNNNTASAKSLEKLSSGLRINRAGDDAAGLAISEKMRGQIRGLDQASRNAQDGISLIQTAEGALNETHSILQRMRELAVQGANDTNTTDDRVEIKKELDQLTSEITRIGTTTEFNTQKLLNGDLNSSVTNVGAALTTTNGIVSIKSVGAVADTYTIATDTGAGTISLTDGTTTETINYGGAPTGFNTKEVSFGSFGVKVEINASIADAADGNFDVTSTGQISLMIGANEGQNMTIDIADMRATAFTGLSAISVATATDAEAAVTTIQNAIDSVSAERSKLGAFQNRLEHTTANLTTSSENLTAAESRIRDVDMAKEMMTFQKNNILSQAATAMLAQANQQPQGVLQLLR